LGKLQVSLQLSFVPFQVHPQLLFLLQRTFQLKKASFPFETQCFARGLLELLHPEGLGFLR
jgi:hypothetical protein